MQRWPEKMKRGEPSISIEKNTYIGINELGLESITAHAACSFRLSKAARAHNRLESRYSNSSGGSYDEEKSKS